MAYILGFFAADGNIIRTKRGTHYISFCSADYETLKDIKDALQSSHLIAARKTETGCVYRLQIGSKIMYSDLVTLGFVDCKSNRMLMPNIPVKYRSDFIRGYFDGDGNVWVGLQNKKRLIPTMAIQVAFTSGSHGFLEGLLILIRTFGIKKGSIFNSKTKNFSRLQFSTKDALKLGEIMYNGQSKLFLQRKKLRFEEFKSQRTAVVAQLVRAPACRRAAFPAKGGLKLSGISVKAKS